MGLAQRWLFVCVCSCCMPWTVFGCKDTPPQHQRSEQGSPAVKQYGGVYRKPMRQEPQTLDPAFITSVFSASIANQLFDGLVQFDADLNVMPSIAKSWAASQDGLTWTFSLRDGVQFHHGREVNAEDFVYTFTRLLDPKTASPRAWLLERIQGAPEFRAGTAETVAGLRALSRSTLQIVLSQPYAPFISVLGMVQVKVLPREEVERLGAAFGRQPVGTGPFRFGHWLPGESMTLEANEAYYAGRPFLDRLHYRLLADNQSILAAFVQGALENVDLTGQEATQLSNDVRFRFMRKPSLATVFLWLDTRQSALGNRQVRQAINYAINRNAISSGIQKNRHVQARGILPLGMPGYDPDLVPYTYNVARARTLLAEAGYPAGKGLPPFELWTSTKSISVNQEHEAIKKDLEHVGIQVELHTAETWEQYASTILGKRPGAMYRYSWFADFPDPDNVLFPLFHSQSSDNYAHYSNPEVDRLLDEARSAGDYLKRIQLYRHIEALIMADAPVVTLSYHTFENVFQPYVRGIELNGLGERYIPMKKIWFDATRPVPHPTPRP